MSMFAAILCANFFSFLLNFNISVYFQKNLFWFMCIYVHFACSSLNYCIGRAAYYLPPCYAINFFKSIFMSISNNVVAATQPAKVKTVKTVKTAKAPIEAKPSETGAKLVKRISALTQQKRNVSIEMTCEMSKLSFWVKMLADAKHCETFISEINSQYGVMVKLENIQKLSASQLGAKMSAKQNEAISERIAKHIAKYPENKGKYYGWVKSSFLNAVVSFYRPEKAAKI